MPSFFATIAFAVMALFCTFTANLVMLVFTNSRWHLSGVVVGILAMAASYWAQHHFTSAGWFREEFERLGPSFVGLQASAERAESMGVLFQYVAIALLVAALVSFVMGLL